MKIDELAVHKAILSKPEIIASKLGISLGKKPLIHHFPISDKNDHIDFVFEDTAGNTYIAEVKLNEKPINVLPQLLEHEYKKFVNIKPELDTHKIIPVIIVDEESTSKADEKILSGMNIKLCTYKLSDIKEILSEKESDETPIPFEYPGLEGIEDYLIKTKKLREHFGDINFLIEGFRGEDWWDGYFDFRVFWLWKQGEYPDVHKQLYQLLCQQKIEDAIWFTFITAISDRYQIAEHMIFAHNWNWSRVIAANNDKIEWGEFEKCICSSGKWSMQALIDTNKRKQVVRDYLEKVKNSQEKYFLNIMSQCDNPFNAYDEVRRSIQDIHNIGNVIAGEFATYLSQWRILPIIPSDNVRVSKYVKKALYSLEIQQPMEKPKDALLRLAKKYSVAPIVIERAMHKIGRRIEREIEE